MPIPVMSDRTCSQQDQSTSPSDPSSPNLEEPGMVSSSPGDINGHSTTGGIAAGRSALQRDGHNPSTSHLVCKIPSKQPFNRNLRAHVGTKSSWTHNSLFRK